MRPVLVVVATQSTTPFTAEDMLEVAPISVLDITEDGARVAATVRRPIDNDFTDHRRFGDPTYLTTSRVSLVIIDVKTGSKDQPFKEMVNIRLPTRFHRPSSTSGTPSATRSPK